MTYSTWDRLGAYLKETQILGSIQNTLYWDQNTSMPKEGASWRAEQLTYIARLLHQRNSSQELSDLIFMAEKDLTNNENDQDNNDNSKQLNIELLKKELNSSSHVSINKLTFK